MKAVVLALLLALSVVSEANAQPLGLSDAVAAHIREIVANHPGLRNDVFSKMGGSSVASNAFLRCFATPYVDLGERQDLRATIDYFNRPDGGSFNRESKAAGVSWNLRYVLGGRPAKFRQELEETQARWALVLFGGNDAQNQNERIYARRLVFLVEQLQEMGVIPVLGAALPRRSAAKDRWIDRFNAITQAVAAHWELPYIDYHSALEKLRRKGLAGDGVHPNVLGEGGVRAACQLTEQGLRYGNNVRNLLTLQMLDELRQTISDAGTDVGTEAGTDVGTEAGTDVGTDVGTDAGSPTGAGTDAGTGTDGGTGTEGGTPAPPDPFPISSLVYKPDLPPAVSLPPRCGSPQPGARLYRRRLALRDRTRIRASALDLDGYRPRVYWVRVDEQGERCVRRRTQTLEVDAGPGMWDLIIEVPERAARQGRMLILVARNPR
jgi:hypothetical protein